MIADDENATTRHCPGCVRLTEKLDAQIAEATMQRERAITAESRSNVETPDAREIICALQAESNDNFARAEQAEAALRETRHGTFDALYVVVEQPGPMEHDVLSVHSTNASAQHEADRLSDEQPQRPGSVFVSTVTNAL